MTDDSLVEEIHRVRARLLADCNDDLDQLLDRYRQSTDATRVVTSKDVEERRLAQKRTPSKP